MKKLTVICAGFCCCSLAFSGIDMKQSNLAGGEDCSSATVIATLPFSDTGSTVGAVNDYDEACPYESTSGDHVYSYTPAANMLINVSLCDSAYDSKVYIYEGACPGILVACNDDACGEFLIRSELERVALTGGSTYYIIVDGDLGGEGDYVIDVEEGEECIVECPAESGDEAEACGDDLNGGCDMVDPAFTTIACGETFCGLGWAADSSRDTDWYEVEITQTEWVTLTVDAEFEVIAGIIETNTPGSGDCADSTGFLDPLVVADACETAEVTAELTPGTYWVFVAPNDFGAYPCASGPWDYILELACFFECIDDDEDGYSPEGGPCGEIDCDDTNPDMNPGMDEACDGVDNDCDGILPDDEADCDVDGYMGCENDCDDGYYWVNPGAVEDCFDTMDNDCDGLVDRADDDCPALDDDSGCGCAMFDSTGTMRPAQIATSGLIYLLPLGFVLIRLRRFRK